MISVVICTRDRAAKLEGPARKSAYSTTKGALITMSRQGNESRLTAHWTEDFEQIFWIP